MPNKCLKQKSYASGQRDVSRGSWQDFIEKRASIQLKADKPRREWREGWRRRQERGSEEKNRKKGTLQKKKRKI